jgi:hypothetical protein
MSTESPSATNTQDTPTHESALAALEQARTELTKAREDLQGTIRALAVDRALSEAGALNLAAARSKLGDTAGLEPAAAVAALRTREPALFASRPRIAPGITTSTPRTSDPAPSTRSRDVAARAATGDRGALLDYMRLRRASA